ncbi:DUF4175 family protein [Allorhodopirellula heiligendammensis]|uniref:Uncharacterized protein n=1 Tax=Allorhodopirellula heiligendammensis TaxID=2714739 RepID=A0A5C6BFX8_9BACT|nr:DUF4175 family protein [Allorhodopirellula heiligendammensis]TWU11053.1 hypothetical protein Poly21_49600 [Allorhodopirellula heiligendammensis]
MSTSPVSIPPVSWEVAERFHSLRRRYFAVDTAIATVLAGIMIGCLWLLLAAGDYVWEWSQRVRMIGLAGGGLVIFAWWIRRLIAGFIGTRERPFANRLEHVFGDFGQRIRTVLDTVEGRVQGPQAMLAALGHQTLGRWETLTPTTLIPSRALVIGGCGLLFVSMAAVCTFFASNQWRTALLRSLGMNLPYTTMTVSPEDTRVLEGSDVSVSLELQGRLDRDVVLRYRDVPVVDAPVAAETDSQSESESAWVETELSPTESRPELFQLNLGKTNRAIEYQFLTSIGDTRVYRIDVQPLIEAQHIEVTVQPPAYTQLEQRKFGTADVAVLQSSDVQVVIETNHPLGRAQLEIGPKASRLQSVSIAAGDDPTLWTFSLPSDDSLVWRFSGDGRDETPMKPVTGRVRVRQDAAPRIAWRDPYDEIRVQPLAELPMRAQIADDYGVTSAGIVFQIGDNDEYVLTDWDVSTQDSREAALTTRLRLEEILPLESFALSERDYISYYAFAVDNRDPHPQRAESDIRYIDIRPLRQFFGEIELEPGTGGGRILVQLDELIRRQRFLINRTRRMGGRSSIDLASQLGTLDRMVSSQSELAGLTRFLTEFLVSRGNDDVEALNQAESAMLQAADSLAAASFDLALAQEEDALRSLAEARRTLEIFFIKNPTAAQQRAMQQFSRQMQQKLRRERSATEQELADELEQIAAAQSQLGQQAQRMTSPPTGKGSAGQMTSSNATATDGSGLGQTSGNPSAAPTSGESQTASDETIPTDQSDAEQASPADNESSTAANEAMENGGVDQLSQQERRDELFAAELDLLERLSAIEERIQDRLTDSPLLRQRMQDAQKALDGLALSARDGSLESFATDSQDATDQLREMGFQLDAIAAPEPVNRVSALRDMTTSLANMEPELADQRRELSEDTQRLGRQLQRRAETIEDVLKAPISAGDVEGSEVSDYLAEFIEENGFLEQLDATQSAAQEVLQDTPGGKSLIDDEGYERARAYADAALQLDTLYRQLVEPRLARLKAIEKRANALAQALGKGGKAAEQTPEAKAEAGVLERELEQEGMSELAETLAGKPPGGGSSDVTDPEPGDGSGAGRFSVADQHTLAGRANTVVRELRRRIQEMILLEVSTDRDAPVPVQYRSAVDQYFRAISDDNGEMTGTLTP